MAAFAVCRCSRIVFVGNIAYHATEKEVIDACEQIGPIVSFKLVVNKDTGKRKGYAFCEYLDDETARSACRNLHGYPLRGRPLRVNLADRRRDSGPCQSSVHQPVGLQEATHAASLVAGAPDSAVTRYLATMSRQQLHEIMSVMRSQDPECAKQLEQQFPGLPTAIEQVQLMLGMAAPDATEKPKNQRLSTSHPRPSNLPGWSHASKLRKLEDGTSVPALVCF